MSLLLQVQALRKSYGADVILDGVDLTFSHGDRIGMIGRNGAGKTTLLRILTGEEEPDSGEVRRASALRWSALEQKDPFRPGERVDEFLERSSGKEEWQCGKIAGRFQLKGDVFRSPIASLPGGFQTRVKLAAMLLRDPNLLLLDEPTNYLDLKTLLLLERFLGEFSGAYVIVSHDREFLKRTCRQTLEIEFGDAALFPGDIEAYLAYKAEQVDLIERQNRNVEAKRKSLQRFVDRYRVRAATASRAQSKLKEIERLETTDVRPTAPTIHLKLPSVEKKKGTALRCADFAIGYPERTVAAGIHFEIERGEHVAVLGDNGEGKTTFLRSIAGQLPPRGGSFEWGYGIRHAFYAQHVYSALPPKKTVLEYLEGQAARDVTRQQVLDLAGCFLFRGTEVDKRIDVLSGGERARACLAGILLSKEPVLLLDEPTNHLDFETVEALATALRDYAGTVFFISHDRTFVNSVATNILDVRAGSIRLFPGDYDSYVYQIERELERASDAEPSRGRPTPRPKLTHEERKERRAQITKLKRRIESAERRLREATQERDAIHAHFLAHPLEPAVDKQKRLEELTEIAGAAENEWLGLNEELERIEGSDGDSADSM